MTELQRRLIAVLVLEVIQSAVSGWCWWQTRTRWRRSSDEHRLSVEGDATHHPMSASDCDILSIRVDRYASLMWIHLWYLIGGILAALGRFVAILSTDQPSAIITASRDLQILVGAILMFRMMAKDDSSLERVIRTEDAQARRKADLAESVVSLRLSQQQSDKAALERAAGFNDRLDTIVKQLDTITPIEGKE